MEILRSKILPPLTRTGKGRIGTGQWTLLDIALNYRGDAAACGKAERGRCGFGKYRRGGKPGGYFLLYKRGENDGCGACEGVQAFSVCHAERRQGENRL